MTLYARLQSARASLTERILALDIPALGLSDYNQRYLGNIIANLERFLELQATLLERALVGNPKPLAETIVVDVGAGTGVFSFLALEAGVGTVVANDIYDVSCRDAALIGQALNTPLDHIVEGDADALIAHLQANALKPDALVSYDVIEHIYDVPAHLKKLSVLHHPSLRIVYASTANIANPKRVREITATQRQVESQTREAAWGHKERDTLTSYLDVRRALIREHAPELDDADLDRLATATRGLAGADITAAVDTFRADGTLSQPDHPTNTCDPHTGNWCEHLLDFDDLVRWCADAGFDATVSPGPFNTCGAPHKRLAKRTINLALRTLDRSGTKWAPYYILTAESRQPATHPSSSS